MRYINYIPYWVQKSAEMRISVYIHVFQALLYFLLVVFCVHSCVINKREPSDLFTV